jgi:hypothetical protein
MVVTHMVKLSFDEPPLFHSSMAPKALNSTSALCESNPTVGAGHAIHPPRIKAQNSIRRQGPNPLVQVKSSDDEVVQQSSPRLSVATLSCSHFGSISMRPMSALLQHATCQPFSSLFPKPTQHRPIDRAYLDKRGCHISYRRHILVEMISSMPLPEMWYVAAVYAAHACS